MFTLHFHTSGGGKEYTLHVHTNGGGRRYTLQVHTDGGGKECTLHVHTAVVVGGGERDTLACLIAGVVKGK